MLERLSSPQPREFERIIPPDAIKDPWSDFDPATETIDVLRVRVPTFGEDRIITITFGGLNMLPVPVDAVAYPFNNASRAGKKELASMTIDPAGHAVVDEVAHMQLTRPDRYAGRTGRVVTDIMGRYMDREKSQLSRFMNVVFEPLTETEQATAIEDTVEGTLDAAWLEEFRSIAMPLFGVRHLGTRSYSVAPRESLVRMVCAIEQFMTKHPDATTKDVRIVALYGPYESIVNGIQEALSERHFGNALEGDRLSEPRNGFY